MNLLILPMKGDETMPTPTAPANIKKSRRVILFFLRSESGISSCIFRKNTHLLNNFLRRKTLSEIVQKKGHDISYYSTLKVLPICYFSVSFSCVVVCYDIYSRTTGEGICST